jgi:hypothetical protein
VKWKQNPAHGFRFSATDALAIFVCVAATSWGLQAIGSTAWLFPFVLGHFFLFCNVFRIPRQAELLWAGCFVTITSICPIFDVSFLNAMWMVLPITAGILIYAARLPTYHGIGSSKRFSATSLEQTPPSGE